jgi:hypothetical protein
MPAYPVTDKEVLDGLIDDWFLNTEEEVIEWSVDHEWLVDGGFVLRMCNGREFLLQVSEVQR